MKKKDLSKTYREINIMLDLLGEPFKQRLPKTMIPFFNEHEDKNYNPKITLSKEGFSENIQTDTYVLMSMMYINYWCENEEEKDNLKNQWINQSSNGDYDVFSNDAYKNNLGVNPATAKYKESADVMPASGSGDVTVDMNKYGNLFDNGGSSSSNDLVVNDRTNQYNKVKTIFGKFRSGLKGLLATFNKK